MLIWVPFIAQITFGKLLVLSNPVQTSFSRSSLGHLIMIGASSISALTTRLVIHNAVLLPTLNRSQIDLNIKK